MVLASTYIGCLILKLEASGLWCEPKPLIGNDRALNRAIDLVRLVFSGLFNAGHIVTHGTLHVISHATTSGGASLSGT